MFLVFLIHFIGSD